MRQFCAAITLLIACVILAACHPSRPQPTATPLPQPGTSAPTAVPTALLPRTSPTPTATVIPTLPVTGSLSCVDRPGDPWRVWRASSSLAAVHSLVIESGELWASTAYGVFSINPNTGAFTRTLRDDTGRFWGSLFPLGEGRIWVSTAKEYWHFDGQAWTTVQLSRAIGSSSPLAIDRNGDFVVMTFESRSYIHWRFSGHIPPQDREWAVTRMPHTETVRIDTCEAQAAASPGYYYRTQSECQSLVQARKIVQQKTGRSTAYTAVDADGSVWWVDPPFASYGSTTLGYMRGNSMTTQTLPVGRVYSIVPDSTHGVWLGTDNGLVYSDGSHLRWVPLGLGGCTVPFGPRSLVVDPQGVAWIATLGGVRAIAPEETAWHHVPDPTLATKPSPGAVLWIALAADGGLWGTHALDMFRLGGAAASTPVELPEPRCFIGQLVADANNVWGFRANCGVMQFNIAPGKWSRHSPGGDNVERVALTTDGTVYAIGQDGLYVYAGGAGWRRAIQSDITMLAPDRQNGLWFVLRQRSQLWYYKDDHVTAHGQPFEKSQLQALTVDSRNQLWASLGDKLQVYDGKGWRTVAAPLRQIRELVGGPDGRIWLVADQGVAVYDPAKDKQP